MRFWTVIVLAGLFFYSGCGEKNKPAVSPAASVEETAALPELAQNKIAANNFFAAEKDEPAFEPVPDDLQKVSPAELELQGPPKD